MTYRVFTWAAGRPSSFRTTDPVRRIFPECGAISPWQRRRWDTGGLLHPAIPAMLRRRAFASPLQSVAHGHD